MSFPKHHFLILMGNNMKSRQDVEEGVGPAEAVTAPA